MGFLNESGFGYFMKKLKELVVGKPGGLAPLGGDNKIPVQHLPVVSMEDVEQPGTPGITPTPNPGDEVRFLRGDGTWSNLPIVYCEDEEGPENPVEGMIWLMPKSTS